MRKFSFYAGALMLLFSTTVNAQSACDDCQNIAPDGDMSGIPTSGQGSLNTFGLNWKSSHGSPSYSPGSLWMWSYNNNGEGVYYDGVTFQAGQTYTICLDIATRTHDGSAPNPTAAFNMYLTNGLVPSETAGGGAPIPPTPPGQTVANIPFSSFPSSFPASTPTTLSFTFTATSTFSQLWIYPSSPTLPQVEVAISNLRICEKAKPCDYDASPYFTQDNCFIQFFANVSPGANVLQYHWDFGDGKTSTEENPIHYYTNTGAYSVTLTVLVVDEFGNCCPKQFKIKVDANVCKPCDAIQTVGIIPTNLGGGTFNFMATGPNSLGFGYSWDFGDGSTGTGQSVNHTYAPGTYVVILTSYYYDVESGECCKSETAIDIKVKSVFPVGSAISEPVDHRSSVNEPMPEWLKERPSTSESNTAVELFPNPNNGKFTVSTDSGKSIEKVIVHDLSGRAIKTINADGKTTIDVELNSNTPGTYSVSVFFTNGESVTKQLVQK